MGEISGTRPDWAGKILAGRQVDREALLALARQFSEDLPADLDVRAVVVFGSVARGDFNVWSDVDVLVVADHLPDRPQDRAGLLLERAPAGVQPVGWTLAEFELQLGRGNPIAVEAVGHGVVVHGGDWLRGVAERVRG